MRKIIGKIVSTKMYKTVVVSVVNPKKHRLYKKSLMKEKRYLAHSSENKLNEGDIVEIIETRPVSSNKHHVVSKVMLKSQKLEGENNGSN